MKKPAKDEVVKRLRKDLADARKKLRTGIADARNEERQQAKVIAQMFGDINLALLRLNARMDNADEERTKSFDKLREGQEWLSKQASRTNTWLENCNAHMWQTQNRLNAVRDILLNNLNLNKSAAIARLLGMVKNGKTSTKKP